MNKNLYLEKLAIGVACAPILKSKTKIDLFVHFAGSEIIL